MVTKAIFTRIDEKVKMKADEYVYNSKVNNCDETDNMRKLIEIALVDYIDKQNSFPEKAN